MIDTTVDLDTINSLSKDTLIERLGIEFTAVGADYISAKMPVDARTVQPFRLLHGGASVALAETLGSMASTLCIDTKAQACVGLDINANHLRSVRGGWVYATARPLHLGRRTHVWEIRIVDDQERLICISRLTVMIVDTLS